MRARRSITDTDEPMDINISPLIDMVFILLIFFIVTTVFVEETGVEVEKPEAASAAHLDKNSIKLSGNTFQCRFDIWERSVPPVSACPHLPPPPKKYYEL